MAAPSEDGRLRTEAPAERRRDTSRVEAFSDGVYAVAITLLVLNLVVPAHAPGGLARALGDLWPAYVAYLGSFLFVGVSWVNHHSLFRRIRAVDAGFLWVNMLLLLTIVPTPFPTAVLANALGGGAVRGCARSARGRMDRDLVVRVASPEAAASRK